MSGKAFFDRWRGLIMTLVSLGALAWTIHLLHDALPELRADLPRLKAAWLVLPLAGCVGCAYVGFEAFRALLLYIKPGVYRRVPLAHLYFVGQLMKHLPGRVWGVAYQTSAGKHVSLLEWASVTLMNMALATGVAVWMSATVLGFRHSLLWGYAAFVAGFAAYGLGWHKRPLSVLLGLVSRLPGRVFGKVGASLSPFVEAPRQFKLKMLLLFFAYWVVYLVSWSGYGLAWPGLHPSDGMALCALYTLAWLAGYFSLITPSGIGVRELVFVFLAHKFPADAVAGLAVFGRAMLLAADIVMGAIYGPFTPGRTRSADKRVDS